MGRLYDNQKTIGYYHGSYVTVNYSDTKEVAKYDGGLITVNGHYVATCDENGYIYSEQNRGVALAQCKDGCVKDLNKSGYNVIAYYDSDMYGAAAAVAALILHLGGESTASISNSGSVQTDSNSSNSGASTAVGSQSSGSDSSGCFSAIVHILLGIIVFVPMCIWCILPLFMICILTLFAVLDEINILDEELMVQIMGFLIVISLIVGSVNAIRIIKNSRQFKLEKKQVRLSRLINNSGIIIYYLFSAVINAFTTSGPGLSLNDVKPAFAPLLEIIALAAICLSPILTIVYLRKCKTKKQ